MGIAKAEQVIELAIKLHRAHMSGAEPTSMKSQNSLMAMLYLVKKEIADAK